MYFCFLVFRFSLQKKKTSKNVIFFFVICDPTLKNVSFTFSLCLKMPGKQKAVQQAITPTKVYEEQLSRFLSQRLAIPQLPYLLENLDLMKKVNHVISLVVFPSAS